MKKIVNFFHPDRPAWTWMPTLPIPLWYLYRWWRNTFCPGTLRLHKWEYFKDELGESEECTRCYDTRFFR